MSTATYANDPSEVRVSYRYKNTLDAEVFNERFINVLKDGIYQKDTPLIEIVSDTEVTVNNFVALVKNENVAVIDSVSQATVYKDILTKIDTRTSKNITGIDYTAPYIVVEFLYTQSESVTPVVKNVAYDSIDTSKQLVLGKCLYKDNVGTKDQMYSIEETRTLEKSPMFEMEDWFDQFMGSPTDSVEVTVKGGLLEGTEVSDYVITYGSGTGEIPLPTSGYHRFDLVYVDDADTLMLIQGEEEVDSGEDEYPLPDKRNLALYSFPVCYIYVTSNHDGVIRKFEPADIINIIPRFMRKSEIVSGSLSDIIITNQTDFEAYFGNNTLTNQGGTTPGKFDDGWVCEYNNSVKSVYVPGKRVAIKNQFDVYGDPVSYVLYSRAVLLSNAEIDCAENVTITLGRTFSGFVTHDNSNMLIDSYSANNIKIKSEKTIANNLDYDSYGDQIPVAVDDKIFLFSKTASICRKYTVSGVVKNVRGSLDVPADVSSFSEAVSFDTCKWGTKLVYAIVGHLNRIYFTICDYNSTTNTYDQGTTWYNDTDVGTTYSNVRIACSGNNLFIVAYNGTRLASATVNLSSPANFSLDSVHSTNSNGFNYPEIYADSSTEFAIIARNTSDNKFRLFVYASSAWSSIEVANPIVVGTARNLYSIVKYSSNYYVSYCKNDGSNDCLYIGIGTTGSITSTKLTSGTDQGYSSKMILSGETNPIYIAYSFNTAKDTIKFAEIVIATPALSSIDTAITEASTAFTTVDFGINSENQFPTAVDLYTIIGVNTGTGDTFFFATSLNKSDWSETSVDLDDNDFVAKIADIKESYLFIASHNADTGTGSFAYKNTITTHHFMLDIDVTEAITPTLLTDLEASNNYVENVLFDAYVDANAGVLSTIAYGFNFSNCIESNFRFNIVNGDFTDVATGKLNGTDGKTYNLVIKAIIDESNTSGTNFNYINHSLFTEIDIVESTTNFDNCYNFKRAGIIDKSVVIDGSGFASKLRYYLSSNQSLTSGVDTTVQFNTKIYDTLDEFNTSNYRFTPSEVGYYHIDAGIAMGEVTAGLSQLSLVSSVDGVIAYSFFATDASFAVKSFVSIDVLSRVGEYFTVNYQHTTGSPKNISGGKYTYFNAHRFA